MAAPGGGSLNLSQVRARCKPLRAFSRSQFTRALKILSLAQQGFAMNQIKAKLQVGFNKKNRSLPTPKICSTQDPNLTLPKVNYPAGFRCN